MHTPRRNSCCATLLLAGMAAVAGSTSAQPARFGIAGDDSLSTDAPVQANDRFTLKAQLVALASTVSELATQTNARFALNAALSTSSLVCYNDTIFRDSFDGTGL